MGNVYPATREPKTPGYFEESSKVLNDTFLFSCIYSAPPFKLLAQYVKSWLLELKYLLQTPCVVGLMQKRGPVILIRTVWGRFLPSPTHETSFCCSAMSGLMNLACLKYLLRFTRFTVSFTRAPRVLQRLEVEIYGQLRIIEPV
jgi:hypothetical protein